jgi:hypothetical protein
LPHSTRIWRLRFSLWRYPRPHTSQRWTMMFDSVSDCSNLSVKSSIFIIPETIWHMYVNLKRSPSLLTILQYELMWFLACYRKIQVRWAWTRTIDKFLYQRLPERRKQGRSTEWRGGNVLAWYILLSIKKTSLHKIP